MPVANSVKRPPGSALTTISTGFMENPIARLFRGLLVLLAVCTFGLVGYRLCGWSWLDSLYMVVITITTVGFEEVRPIDTVPLRIITIVTVIFGYVAAIMLITGFAQMVIDGELRKTLGVRRKMSEIEKLRRHVIICGYGRMGRLLAHRLRGDRPVLVIDNDDERVEEATESGFLALRGNATEEGILRAARIEHASTLASVVADDASNLFITLTARGLNRNLQILARGEQSSTASKLRQVGANHVVLTASIGADRLSQLILRPSAAAMLQNEELPTGLIEDLETIGLTMEELELAEQSPLRGKTLRDLRNDSGWHRFLFVAIRRADGEVLVSPAVETVLRNGDGVLILGYDEDLQQLCGQYELVRESVGDDQAEAVN